MRKFILLIIVLLIAGVGLAFYFGNQTKVPLNLFFVTYDNDFITVGMVALGALIIGGLSGLLAGSGIMFKVKRSERAVKKKLVKSEKELDSLRSNVG